MARKGQIVYFLSFIVAFSALITFQFPANPPLRESAQTELVLETAAEGEVIQEENKPRISKRFNILRWHNHTINLHLRNVRSRWLTITTPEQHLPVTYPEEEARI